MSSESVDSVRIVYILYLVGSLCGPLMFLGVILAYKERGKITGHWLYSHVDKQIRMFWIWLLLSVVSAAGLFATFLPTMFSNIFVGHSESVFSARGVLFFLFLLLPIGLLFYVTTTSCRFLRKLSIDEENESS